MDELTILRTVAACTTILAAAMVAANLNARITVTGFAIFIAASIAWMADGWFESKSSLVIQNAILLLINILGVWRWLPQSRERSTGQKSRRSFICTRLRSGLCRAPKKKIRRSFSHARSGVQGGSFAGKSSARTMSNAPRRCMPPGSRWKQKPEGHGRTEGSRSMSDAPAGVTGNGGTHFMPECRRTTGSSTT